MATREERLAFAERLATLLDRLGKKRGRPFFQEELADEIGVTRGAVGMWMTAKNGASSKNIKRIAEYAGVSYEWLSVGSGDIMKNDMSVGGATPPEIAAETLALEGKRVSAPPPSRALLPVWAMVDKGYEVMLLTEDAVRHSEGPPLTGGRVVVFGVQVSSDDMVPVIRPGSTIWIEATRQAAAPEVAFFERLDQSSGRQSLVREIVRNTDAGWLVRRYGSNPADYELKRDEWEVMRIASIEPL